MPRYRKLALAGAFVIPVVAGGFLLHSKAPLATPQLVSQVFSLVSGRYVDTLSDSAIYEKAAQGLVRQLNDPFSVLLTPADMKNFNTQVGGHYGGVGMQIEDQQGQITISKVYPNSPAEGAGIHEGDHIVQVGPRSTSGWTIQQVSDSITGDPGTQIAVRFTRPGVAAPIDVKFTRAVIVVPAVPFAIVLDNKIGYLPLQSFSDNSADETRAALKRLLASGAKSIVFDLRGNPGGIVDQSVKIASLFLKPGEEIASIRGRAGAPETYTADGDTLALTIPMVVLVDPYTASAAEIVSGGLQDHDRALILGEPSFGKGLVQSVYNLDGGYALKLTTAKWYTPSGRSIQRDRKVVNGEFVAEAPDTTATELSKSKRPAFKSDAGRTVYGGGGITPDLLVADDTMTAPEQRFVKAITPQSQEFYIALYQYGLQLSKQVQPGFQVQPAWRSEFYDRITTGGVKVSRALYDSAQRYVDRSLVQRVTRFAFGDSAAKRRDLPFDAPLRKAIDLLQNGGSQQTLFAIVKK